MSEPKKITKEFLKKFLRSNFKLYYSTPSLNDCLYLHYKGFERIENLEEFTGLKVLYLEGNGFSKIEGLDCLQTLRCLYLQENLIKTIENFNLPELINLNLSDNMIETISGLENCLKLSSLQVKRNRIGVHGISDIEELAKIQSLTVLDISDNKIEDEDVLEKVFIQMPNLAVLYLHGNPCVKKISNYRKKFIYTLKNLKFLDDRPVFEDERRFCEAFQLGGLEAERLERQKYKKEQEEAHLRNHQAFDQMIRRYREDQNNVNNVTNITEEHSLNSQTEESEESKSENEHSLETYYSERSSKGSRRESREEERRIELDELE